MERRRSVGQFSDTPVEREVIIQIILAASTAPSGAHRQPWTFCVVFDPVIKQRIRAAAEKEEFESCHGSMPPEWLEDIALPGTDWHKPFLETAHCLIVVFKRAFEWKANGAKRKNYYVEESVGTACGLLFAASKIRVWFPYTHTPSPMSFLTGLLDRPANERPFLLIPGGYPADDHRVPDLKRKALEDEMVSY